MLRYFRRRPRRINKDDKLGGLVRSFRSAKQDGFDARVVEIEIMGKVVANNFGAGFGEQTALRRIVLGSRRSDDGNAKPILLEKLSGIIKSFFIL